jgi:hypothetical protein
MSISESALIMAEKKSRAGQGGPLRPSRPATGRLPMARSDFLTGKGFTFRTWRADDLPEMRKI